MALFHSLAWALVACEAGGDSGDGGSFVASGQLKLTPSPEIATYYEASWTSDEAGRTRVEVFEGDTPVLVTDWHSGHDVLHVPILGVWPSTTFTARLVDEERGVIARETFTTESGPTDLMRMTANGTSTWTGYLVTEIATTDVQTVVVLAPNGKPVWYWQTRGSYVGRASLRRDGLGVWVLVMPSAVAGSVGWIGSVAWDGTLLADVAPVGHDGEGATHDLLELEDGRVVFLGTDTRTFEGVEYVGDSVFALNTDGSETELWSFWDDLTPDERTTDPLFWTHANALRWNEDRETLWVGSRELSMLVELDPATWRPVNEFAGTEPTFHFAPGTSTTDRQHQFDFHGDRLAVHDNRDPTVGTRLVIYDLDFASKPPQVEQTYEYVPDPTIFDFVLGDVSWLDDNRVIMSWSTTGLMEERSLDGDAPWSISLDLGSIFPYTQHVDSLPGCTPGNGG